jgi:hypothetical protein
MENPYETPLSPLQPSATDEEASQTGPLERIFRPKDSLKAPISPDSPDLTEIGDESLLILTRQELDRIFDSILTGEIQHRDLSVLLVYMCRTDWRTARTRCTAEAAANKLGVTKSYIYQSLKRLSAALLLISVRDKRTGEKMKMVNPHVMKCGGHRNRSYLLKVFEESVNDAPSAGT